MQWQTDTFFLPWDSQKSCPPSWWHWPTSNNFLLSSRDCLSHYESLVKKGRKLTPSRPLNRSRTCPSPEGEATSPTLHSWRPQADQREDKHYNQGRRTLKLTRNWDLMGADRGAFFLLSGCGDFGVVLVSHLREWQDRNASTFPAVTAGNWPWKVLAIKFSPVSGSLDPISNPLMACAEALRFAHSFPQRQSTTALSRKQ